MGTALYLALILLTAQITLGSSHLCYSDLLRPPVDAVLAIVMTAAGATAVA